jgi:DNA polymerase alpha-associated DNA helicase A
MTRAKRQLVSDLEHFDSPAVKSQELIEQCVVGDPATVGQGSKYLKGWMEWLEGNADVRYAGEEVI